MIFLKISPASRHHGLVTSANLNVLNYIPPIFITSSCHTYVSYTSARLSWFLVLHLFLFASFARVPFHHLSLQSVPNRLNACKSLLQSARLVTQNKRSKTIGCLVILYPPQDYPGDE